MSDYDSRLVQLYDDDNTDGPDRDFFRTLAEENRARTIVDLGCGTGLLTVSFCKPGRSVFGIDPSRSMLDHARARPGAESVTWILGDSSVIPQVDGDLVVMSANVAQLISGKAWRRALADIYQALRPGGLLAFDRRNPVAREWEGWTKDKSYGTRSTTVGELTEWMEAGPVSPSGDVSVNFHNVFTATDDHVVEHQTFSFLDEEEVSRDLKTAGFDDVGVWGGWNHEPTTNASPLMVFEARKN